MRNFGSAVVKPYFDNAADLMAAVGFFIF